jgi:hypothetical protein
MSQRGRQSSILKIMLNWKKIKIQHIKTTPIAMLSTKFITVNPYIRKERKSEICNLNCLSNLEINQSRQNKK